MIVLGLQGRPVDPTTAHIPIDGPEPKRWYHDSAAVLLVDGELVAAVEEERLSRVKHTGDFPWRAVRACLELGGVELSDVDLIGFGEQGGSGRFRDPAITSERVSAAMASSLGERPAAPVQLVDHHLAHAMSSFAASAFGEALVLTADGFGDGASGSVIHARGWSLDVLARFDPAASLGSYYSATLPLLGFGAHDEFKAMGLAPYGDPARFRRLFRATYRLLPGGAFELDRPGLVERLDALGPPRSGDAFTQRDRDVAAASQEALETIVMHVVDHWLGRIPTRRLCLAGGVMHNSTLAGKLAGRDPGLSVFVQPAAGDAGLALGAAFVAALTAGDASIRPMATASLGRDLPDRPRLTTRLEAWRDLVSYETSVDVAADTAALLVAGEVVGWVQGRSEWGPRALGNRSILADARRSENKERVNELVKRREAFRPFAPVVRADEAHRYFEIPAGIDPAYMTFVVPVVASRRGELGATTHVDGSARVQTVTEGSNPLLWRLLGEVGARSGVGVLLNTSFNDNCEPIVDSVDDAIVCFLTSGLDALVIGEHIVRRHPGELRVGSLVGSLPGHVELLWRTVDDRHGRRPACELRRGPTTETVSPAVARLFMDGSPPATLDERLAGVRERDAVIAEICRLWRSRWVALLPGMGA